MTNYKHNLGDVMIRFVSLMVIFIGFLLSMVACQAIVDSTIQPVNIPETATPTVFDAPQETPSIDTSLIPTTSDWVSVQDAPVLKFCQLAIQFKCRCCALLSLSCG